MMFGPSLSATAEKLLACCRNRKLRIATAESCTGGLVAGLLTSIPGASDVFDAGFVTYSNGAKSALIGVPVDIIRAHGAVSEATARAMAEGAVASAPNADIGLAVTGIAGPGGGSPEKPVGLVHVAVARSGFSTLHRKLQLGDRGRENIRLRSVSEVLELAVVQASAGP